MEVLPFFVVFVKYKNKKKREKKRLTTTAAYISTFKLLSNKGCGGKGRSFQQYQNSFPSAFYLNLYILFFEFFVDFTDFSQ